MTTTWLGIASCTDAPSAPEADEGAFGSARFAMAEQPEATDGLSATSRDGRIESLTNACGRVDRFRMRVARQATGEVVLDEVIEVSWHPPFELSATVPRREPDGAFEAELTALEGATVLFEAGPVEVRTAPESLETKTTVVDAGLEYVGPGARAAAIEVSPAVVAPSPGAGGAIKATVRGVEGGVQRNVPLSWASSDGGLLTARPGRWRETASRRGRETARARTTCGAGWCTSGVPVR